MKKMFIITILANALIVPSVFATSITWNYDFKTTPDGEAGKIEEPIATLTLEDVTNIDVEGKSVDGVKFTLSNLGTSKYDTSSETTYIEGLFLNVSPESAFETQWEEAQLSEGNAKMDEVEFGEDEHPNDYDYSIEVNFEEDTLKENENVSWIFYSTEEGVAPAVSDFLFSGVDDPAPGPDASYPQEVWSTIKMRGVNPELGELVHSKETIHVVAPADIDALFDWAENTYPEYFSSHAESQKIEGYYARYYPDTNIYLGSKDGRVYAYGAVFGGLLDAGGLEEWLLKATN